MKKIDSFWIVMIIVLLLGIPMFQSFLQIRKDISCKALSQETGLLYVGYEEEIGCKFVVIDP